MSIMHEGGNEEFEAEDQAEHQHGRADHLRPWQYKKGQSGNPGGRPPGISLKEYVKKKFNEMTDEEREDFLNGMDKEKIWEMAEGKAVTPISGKDADTDLFPAPLLGGLTNANASNNSNNQAPTTEEED